MSASSWPSQMRLSELLVIWRQMKNKDKKADTVTPQWYRSKGRHENIKNQWVSNMQRGDKGYDEIPYLVARRRCLSEKRGLMSCNSHEKLRDINPDYYALDYDEKNAIAAALGVKDDAARLAGDEDEEEEEEEGEEVEEEDSEVEEDEGVVMVVDEGVEAVIEKKTWGNSHVMVHFHVNPLVVRFVIF